MILGALVGCVAYWRPQVHAERAFDGQASELLHPTAPRAAPPTGRAPLGARIAPEVVVTKALPPPPPPRGCIKGLQPWPQQNEATTTVVFLGSLMAYTTVQIPNETTSQNHRRIS